MLSRIKDQISRMAQRALGIEGVRSTLDVVNSKLDVVGSKVDAMGSKLDVIGSKLDVVDSKLDVVGSKLDVVGSKLDVVGSKLDVITNKLAQLDPKLQNLIEKGESLFWQIRQVSEGLDRLRSFLTWSANRVEPWLPAESFSQTEPDYDLAGFLYNFLPNRVAVDVGATDSEFAKALSGIGYQVFCFAATAETFEKLRNETVNLPRVEVFDFDVEAAETLPENAPTNGGPMDPSEHRGDTPRVTTIASLMSSGILPPQIDLVKIDTDCTNLEVTKGLASVCPAVVQIDFSSEDVVKQRKDQMPVVSASENIKAMRDLGYYWNIIIFRVDSEDFVRMAANLGGTPRQSWGKIFFFQDYQLFLKAHQWCKGALPRFRASSLPGG
jgi:FkbM family methyltransferase